MAITIQTTTYKVIYIYSRDAHPGLLKIGKTSVDAYSVEDLPDNCAKLYEATKERIKEAATFGITDIHILHTEVGFFVDSAGVGKSFDDHAVHEVLKNSGYHKAEMSTIAGIPDEWFEVPLEKAVEAIKAVKEEKETIDGPKIIAPKMPEIRFRDEQEQAIFTTISHFNAAKGSQDIKMLWNAKMRFGKTLCALELVNQLNVNKVLILTHRPTVRSGWFDDYHLIKFTNQWQYGSKQGKKHAIINDKENHKDGYFSGKDLETLQHDLASDGIRYIYFASMQDLRGQKVEYDKDGKVKSREWKENNALVYDTKWDLIIFDEAHEGTQTALGKEVIAGLTYHNNPLKLYLSGTPFNILSQFSADEIFTWDYVMEQTAKKEWEKNHPHEPNPYEGLAQLNIYTYNLGEVFENNPEYVKKSDDDYFNFSEFFRTFKGNKDEDGIEMPSNAAKGHFIHENDVVAFLDLLCQKDPDSQYPYSNDDFCNALSHTLWMLPGVAQAARLAMLIHQHRLHTEFGFEVVNVAGEGNAIDFADPDDITKIEKKEKDALQKVQNAIKAHKRTITLSCGKLTTGVSVPEWTGVFMLSGGYSTGAASYMQTIFRGQTPYKNGAIKSNCYAFDFAPDRTLTVIDDYIKMQPSSSNGRNHTHGDRVKKVEEHLKFCPVISMKGSEEVKYDALTFVKKVNQAYSEHIISNGFKSRYLFKNMAMFTQADHDLLATVDKMIGGAKVSKNSDGKINIAQNDLRGDKFKKETNGKGSKERPDTPQKIKNNPKSRDLEQRRNSQRVLDAIFVRFPLLLFGAVEDASRITLQELLSEDVIDSESWEEFMPKGLTKTIFNQLAHLIDIDNMISSTSVIIQQTKDADSLPIQQRIIAISRMIEKFHFTDKETVLTPWRVVNMHMVETLGGYDFYDESHTHLLDTPELREQEGITDNIFCNPDAHILEINSKSGVYPLWIAHTFWALLRNNSMTHEQDWALWKKVVENNVYVVCKTRMAEKITKRVLCGFNKDIHANTVSFENLIDRLKDSSKLASLKKQICNQSTYGQNSNNMINFEAVVGNPPYQVMDGGAQASAKPVYHYFVQIAKDVCPRYISIIMPTRWYAGGRGLDEFRDSMLNDKQIKIIHDFLSPDSLFSGTNIRGGICFILWDTNDESHEFVSVFTHDLNGSIRQMNRPMKIAGLDIFIRDAKCLTILDKVRKLSKYMLEKEVSSLRPFGFRGYFVKDENFRKSKVGLDNPVTCIGKGRTVGYIEYEEISTNVHWVNKHKVLMPRANNIATELNDDNLNAFVAFPNTICTESYLAIGCDLDLSEQECSNMCIYLKTQFARYMHSIAKSSQDATSKTFKFVPLQDFTSGSDIDWSVSVAEIDKQLYDKYGLTSEEREFIESMIKPME